MKKDKKNKCACVCVAGGTDEQLLDKFYVEVSINNTKAIRNKGNIAASISINTFSIKSKALPRLNE